ncbi:MAG: diguanylate cyclase [Microthrixaceae bacterium]
MRTNRRGRVAILTAPGVRQRSCRHSPPGGRRTLPAANWGTGDYQVSGSIGIARIPEHADTPEDALSHADLALYQAKRNGPPGTSSTAANWRSTPNDGCT